MSYIVDGNPTYSGRNTSYQHKWAEKHAKEAGLDLESWIKQNQEANDCIRQEIVFDVQWSSCPVEVEAEVRKLWRDHELGNDDYHYDWDHKEDHERYPIIAEYLKFRGVEQCKIVWWW